MNHARKNEALPRREPFRPQCHFTPERHWINDPNGLVWFEGEYHLFYQYNPFGDQWGHMSWGHAVSADLVHWQELPVAIPEDERVSIFSGSIVVDEHNSSGFGDGSAPPLVAIYTGCLRRPEGGQAQELAYSHDRGRTWTKYAANPVLDLGLRDFRDPKVFWHTPTQKWVMVVVLPDERRAQFYGSPDLKSWTLLSEFERPFEGQGIWECPDLIPMKVADEDEPVWMLKVDALQGHPSGGSGARLFFGQFDGTRFIAEPEVAPRWVDHGGDFYAALSWSHLPSTCEHNIWLAWMSCHEYAKYVPTHPWRGAMTLPRELSLRRTATQGWDLLQAPIASLQSLRDEAHVLGTITLSQEHGAHTLSAAAARALEIQCHITQTSAQQLGLILSSGAHDQVRLGYDATRGCVFIDRGPCRFHPPEHAWYAARTEAAYPAPSAAQPLRLRVLVDASSIELFVGDGELVMTEQIYCGDGAEPYRITLFSDKGSARFEALCLWTLKSIQGS